MCPSCPLVSKPRLHSAPAGNLGRGQLRRRARPVIWSQVPNRGTGLLDTLFQQRPLLGVGELWGLAAAPRTNGTRPSRLASLPELVGSLAGRCIRDTAQMGPREGHQNGRAVPSPTRRPPPQTTNPSGASPRTRLGCNWGPARSPGPAPRRAWLGPPFGRPLIDRRSRGLRRRRTWTASALRPHVCDDGTDAFLVCSPTGPPPIVARPHTGSEISFYAPLPSPSRPTMNCAGTHRPADGIKIDPDFPPPGRPDFTPDWQADRPSPTAHPPTRIVRPPKPPSAPPTTAIEPYGTQSFEIAPYLRAGPN